MCLIIAKPAGVKVPRDWVINAADNNEDSIGVAYYDEGRQKIHKWIMPSLARINRAADLIESLTDKAVLIHFRLTTHGRTNELNCHPFPLGHGAVIAHNGIISGADCPKRLRSDTKVYIDEVIMPWVNVIGLKEFLSNMDDITGKEIGSSKLCAMDSEGNFFFANEKLGDWVDGCWLSNKYSIVEGWFRYDRYEPSTTRPTIGPAGCTPSQVHSYRYDDGWTYDQDIEAWVNEFDQAISDDPWAVTEISDEGHTFSTTYSNALEWGVCPECGGPTVMSGAHNPSKRDYCTECEHTVFACGLVTGPMIRNGAKGVDNQNGKIVRYSEAEYEQWARGV